MLDRTDGTSYTLAFQTAWRMFNTKRYAPGFVASDAEFGYGVLPASSIASGENTDEYRRTVASGPTPQDPNGYTNVDSGTGWIAVWIDYDVNVPPNAPTSVVPSAGASVSGLTPTFAGDFRDANETLTNGLPGDKLGSVQIQVRAVGTTTLLWNFTYAATLSEQTARRFSAVYAGTALTTGTSYEWRSRVADQFGAWSAYTGWTQFSPGAGYVSTSGTQTPSGVQQTRTPGPFTGTWSHTGGLTATAAFVRISDTRTGAVVRETAAGSPITLSPAVATGGTISITWVQTGFTQLDPGGQYSYQIKARASNGVETNYSSAVAFSINAAPTVPVLVTPINGAVISARPELVATSTDADDTPGSGFVVTARIKDSAGTVLQSRAMTYDATTQRWRYQTTSGDLATTGTYRWDAYAYDGTFYSNGTTVNGANALSTEVVFTYAVGPAITITAPTEGASVNTDAPLYPWTVTDQVRKRVRVFERFEDGSSLMVYDSGQITDGTSNHRQPSGYLQNGSGYRLIIDVWNSANQQGTSTERAFTVDFDSASTINNVTASAFRAAGDTEPSAVLLSWDQTTYPASQFQEYVITRRAVAGQLFDVDDELGAQARRIGVISNPGVTTFVDYLPASGITYVYGVKQVVEISGTSIASAYAHAEMTITFDATVICDAVQGGARRVVLPYRKERSIPRTRNQLFVQPWGESKPVAFRTNEWGRTVAAEYLIIGDTPGDVQETIVAIDALDQGGGPLCYRDGRGRRYFGEISDFTEVDPEGGRVRRVSITFTQTNAREGILT
jgi:hypothetical protein